MKPTRATMFPTDKTLVPNTVYAFIFEHLT